MRSENYKKLLGSRRWKNIRMTYLAAHPLCEICLQKGRTTAASEVHHKDPIDNYKDFAKMEEVAFDMDNLQALCHDCHRRVHEAMESQTAATNVRRAKAAAREFMDKWTKRQ